MKKLFFSFSLILIYAAASFGAAALEASSLFDSARDYQKEEKWQEAIDAYLTCTVKPSKKEEIWYSKWMLGKCYQHLHNESDAIYWFMEAYQENPNRAEPLHDIAKHYRTQGKPFLGHFFAKWGSTIPHPGNDAPFCVPSVYTYQFDEELSISAFYTPFRNDGYAALSRLLVNKEAPWPVKSNGYRSLLFYVKPLENASYIPLPVNLPLIREGFPDTYLPMNPSIQKKGDGYELICRTINWAHTHEKGYFSRDPHDTTIRTKNFLIHYDANFKILSQKEITENLPRKKYPTMVQGFEDCRLFYIDNEPWFTASLFDTQPHHCVKMSLCSLTEQETTASVETLSVLEGAGVHAHGKNWLPFSTKDGTTFIIYCSHPLIIYRLNKESGELTTEKHEDSPHDFSAFRGSAPPIPWQDGYLYLIHEVMHVDGKYGLERRYLHRFVWLDSHLTIKKISKPFVFQHIGIEYCCGMTTDHAEKNLILSIGIEDKEAHLCTVSIPTINNMLEAL